ncbi:hypothetical protein AKJ09_00337 [Labilithrix luteola]|uniref:TIGR03118 family protein n=2 Tax=Labilithrix luteola TaxID=1391654 RepID=A0A0K1PJE9_9BACT|nr:hypothetical protein AKJ09_00337 [Labilithrix luteola]
MLALGLVGAACGTDREPSGTSSSTSPLETRGSGAGTKIAAAVNQTVLVTDDKNPDLVNAWGLAFAPTGRAWIADNGSGKASIYDGNISLVSTRKIPAPSGTDTSAPTGLVLNDHPKAFDGDAFIAATEDGTIVGLPASGDGTIRVDNSGNNAVYKGVTIASSGGQPRIYATNFHANKVEVFDEGYKQVNLAQDAFTDSTIPSDFAPFNVAAIGGVVIVTYAKQNDQKHDDVKGAGNGFINAFDADGNLLSRVVSNGPLNSPWGMAVTPDAFGNVPHRLLVGNFGDGAINVFDVDIHDKGLVATFEGAIGDAQNQPLAIDGLWSLRFAPSAGGFDSHQLFFTAGPNDEKKGAFGRLDLVTTPR